VADRSEPVVDDSSTSEATEVEPVVETEPSANPSVGETASVGEAASESENTPTAEASVASAAQPESSGWQSAVFAPKPAIIRSEEPSEPAVQTGQLVESGPDVIDPVLIEHPKLKYPKQAKRRKVETIVRVRVLVDEKGNVLEAELDREYGYGLDEAALQVALKARFIPATKGTVKVKMWTSLPLAYRLKK
jgi:TonB family protein